MYRIQEMVQLIGFATLHLVEISFTESKEVSFTLREKSDLHSIRSSIPLMKLLSFCLLSVCPFWKQDGKNVQSEQMKK